jgi:hypothetical protein
MMDANIPELSEQEIQDFLKLAVARKDDAIQSYCIVLEMNLIVSLIL